MITETYRVSCEQFEGPLDLLLYLVRKQEVEIRNISLSRITREYLLFIRDIDRIDFDGAGEFLRYAATLLAIKAREMSDVDEQEHEDGEYETRESLIRRLEEYRKFKEKGLWLRKKLEMANTMFPRPPEEFEKQVNITMDGLIEMLESIEKEEPFNPPTTILFHIDHLIEKLLSKLNELKSFVFSKVVTGSEHLEIVGTFFALLEVIRQGKARARQENPFDEIYIRRN